MLTTLSTLLETAKQEKRAVGAFNVYNLETILAVVEAANRLKSPVIISFGEGYFSHAPVEAIAAIVKEICTPLAIQVVLHLDHAKELKSIARAIRAGFTSVMYDGSALPLCENIKNTKHIVEYAHAVGVSVEGELGYMNNEDGTFEEGLDLEKGYTSVQDAAEYVASTGIDALAVAIGNAHGIYKGKPTLDFVQLGKIGQAVPVPIVLHGCSGIPDDYLRKAVSLGVSKINVNTEISTGAVLSARKFLAQNTAKDLRFETVLMDARHSMSATVERFIKLLS
ncbi:class II fructose-bisphosphate aldolase [Pelosinus propionicus]|uniref:Fructose-bisphosphate aldolase, class II n=1 Tax=Pelosinus propionicus DSM 13327 TaxID=1123291 RepID=A0A1I4LGH9_9FIRM|nr:class II fructose-bisphosphate aldolase [Pelosinus propionicus]SFL90009.1 fructose-bisphosphate aldolase, class II [Pelosinus propionicus DSM 13327]